MQSEPKREAVAQHFLTLAGYDRVYLPRLRTVHRRQGRRIDLKVPLFPGYLFVWVTTGWWAARWCPHVVRIITNGGMEPAHVADSLIESIRRQEVNGAVELPKTLGLKSGDQVRILQGPLQGHLGLYAGQRSHERVLVLLALLGGHQRVELAKDAIEVVRS